MDLNTLAPLLRMAERSLIVLGGILSIYLGYKLFVMGIDRPQGAASALGIELKNFGPGLFFAALGAVILVTTMKAAIRVDTGGAAGRPPAATPSTAEVTSTQPQPIPAVSTAPTQLFFGVEDPSRHIRKWAPLSFFAETRELLKRLDDGEAAEQMADQRKALATKLESITMSRDEYERYQALTSKVPLSDTEQAELLELQTKLVP
jgi:hypothetical protein